MPQAPHSLIALRNLILKAKHAYYYSGEPIMSDVEYDALEDQLRQIAPDDPVLALVGSPVPADTMLTKARHSIPMGSQSKVNSEVEFMTWAQKCEGSAIHASLKGDGASAAAYYQQGRLVQAISRGDGTVGEDITANAMRFKGLPAWVGAGEGGFTGAVRFEVILTVDDWTAIDPSRSKNPRNAGNGIMGRKNGHQSDCLTIFAFDIDETINGVSRNFSTEADKSQRLAELGFNLISQRLCETAEEAAAYFRETAEQRETLPFWIDGVVLKMNDLALQERMGVTSGRPKGQVAWKFDSTGAETVLEGVVVSGGHTGGLYPTAQLRPVDIGGTTVSNASLANYDEIARLDVAIGDSVWVIKANDIIPKIVRVTHRPPERQSIEVPTQCPFCVGEVGRRRTTSGSEGVILVCRNPGCPKKSTGKINRWISSLDILGIGDVVLESVIERFDLADAADLYTLRNQAGELADLVINVDKDLRLGQKRAQSILEAIDATRALALSRFLGSLGLDHLGKRRVELMIRAAEGELNTLADWRSGKLRDPAVAEKAGVPNIGSSIQDGIDAMGEVIDKMLANGVTVHDVTTGDLSDQPAALGKSVCISGKLPSGKKKDDYDGPLKTAGYALVDDVSKGLAYLVLADPASTSSKAEKARKLGIPIISEDDLASLCTAVPDTPVSIATLLTPPRKTEITMVKSTTPTSLPVIPTEGEFRRFEFIDDKSSKFWEIRVVGRNVEVRYGKIGTSGQMQVKEFDDESVAQKHAEKIKGEKLKGGYVATNMGTEAQDQTTVQTCVKSSTQELVNSLKLDKKQNLTGEYPRELDLGDLQLDLKVIVNDPEALSRAAKKGLAPQANLAISSNATLETLRIPSDDLGMSYVLVENCPNLRKIEVYRCSPTSRSSEPKWLICKDLPKLETFIAAGPLLSLEIDNVPNLKVINVGRCTELALLSLRGASSIQELEINGCVKLPWVQGLTEKQEILLSVASKIDANCAISTEAAFPFQKLNFRQIDEILEIINKGMMADFESGRPNRYSEDPSILKFSVLLLRPLESTYSGGTGEQYAYELFNQSGAHLDELCGDVRGEHSPEDCLNSALRYIKDFIIIDDVDDQNESMVFDYLKNYGKSTSASQGLQQEISPVMNQIESKVTRTLCISGKLDSGLRKADYETALRNVDISLVDDVAKGLTYLVLADPAYG
jgi:DNA ligase (NAD+)